MNWILISVIALCLSALFSGIEIAFVTSERVRIEIDARGGSLSARIINRFYANSEFFISSVLVGNNIVLVVYGMGMAALIEPWLETFIDSSAAVLALQTLISTVVILLMGEFLPKNTFRINPNSSLRVFALPMYALYVLLYPISLLATGLSRLLMRLFGVKTNNARIGLISLGELNTYLEDTIDDLEERQEEVQNEVKIFQNALDFSSTHLRDCMIPRNEIVAVNLNTTRQQLSELFTSTGRSKILVYDDDIDTILGYIHVSELFTPDVDWTTRLKPVLYAPETLLANKMMRRLLSEKRSIAIVVDEFGGTAGMVTLEDLVEEIFGDIQDEHDSSGLVARKISDGVYEFSGRQEIEALNEQYHLDIPESDEYQTLAGFVLNVTGSIPARGEKITVGNLELEVVRKSATRLELIRLTVL